MIRRTDWPSLDYMKPAAGVRLWSTRAVGLGLGTAVLGFGAMSCLARWGNYPHDLPTLYSYRSATWGDGLLLPMAAASLVVATDLLPARPRERSLSRASFIVGALTGLATQVAWLRDPSPRLNWTLPTAHHFNTAGWYHAFFLVAASGMFAALWTRLGFRVVRAEEISPRVRGGILVAGLSSAGFVALVAVDNAPDQGNYSGMATIIALTGCVGGFLLGGVTIAARRRQYLRSKPVSSS